MTKIFFGCSMRGGYGSVNREYLAKIPDVIEELGYEIASKHQTQIGIITEENKHSKTHIHDRDYKWLSESDVGIFEISNPSLGTGAEIADMVHQRKPVLCLYRKELGDSVSAYALGKQGSQYVSSPFECYGYETLEDIRVKIRSFIDAL